MDKIHEIAGDGALMPGFDDGMVNMSELINHQVELSPQPLRHRGH